MITFKELQKLTTVLSKIYQCNEMKHAWRFNGIVDIYKNGNNVFSKIDHTHRKFNHLIDLEMYVLEILKPNKSVSKFEVKAKPTYKDFKNKIMPAVMQSTLTEKPEDYHWHSNSEIKGDSMYFLFHNGFVKIGRTKDMANRINQLKTSLSCDYECFVFEGKGYLERKFHHIFNKFRQSGEWFMDDVRFRAFVSKRLSNKDCYLFNAKTYKKPLITEKEKHTKSNVMDFESVFCFGKHKGKKVIKVLEDHYGYFEWMEINVKNFHEKYHEEVHRYMREKSRELNFN